MAYEGLRDALPKPDFATVPTPAERAGDFSALLKVSSLYQIYDPATGSLEGSRIRRTPFPNNVIPAGRISPISKHYLDLFPASNTTGRPDGGDNFLSPKAGEINSYNNEIGRLDITLSQRHKLFYNFRYNERMGWAINSLGYNPLEPAGSKRRARPHKRRDHGGRCVHAHSHHRVEHARGLDAFSPKAEPISPTPFDLSSFGFPASLNSKSQFSIMPRVGFVGFAGGRHQLRPGRTPEERDNPQDIFQIFTNLTRVANRHSLKVGVDLRLYRESSTSLGYTSGLYSFSTNWDAGAPSTTRPRRRWDRIWPACCWACRPPAPGISTRLASTKLATLRYSCRTIFHVRPDLTLNLGVRYERDLPHHGTLQPVGQRFSTAPAASPVDAAGARRVRSQPDRGDCRAAVPRAGRPAIRRRREPESLRHIGPTTSVRGSASRGRLRRWAARPCCAAGGGVFFSGIGTIGVNQHGFSQSTDFIATLDGYLTPSSTLANPFPSGIQQPPGSQNALSTDMGKNVVFYNTHPLNPYSVRWNFMIQRQLRQDTVLEVGYMGNHAVHLPVDAALNYVPRQYLSTSASRDQAVINNLTANVANPFAGLLPGTTLNGSTVARQQLLRPLSAIHRRDLAAAERRQFVLPHARRPARQAAFAGPAIPVEFRVFETHGEARAA